MTEYIMWLLQEYRYPIVFMGAMIEGETIVLGASALAVNGTFSLWPLMGTVFLGTLLADQLIYVLGLRYGKGVLGYVQGRFPSVQASVQKALSFLQKYQTLYILTFRFIYGIRIISPFIIGAQGVPFRRFSLLNVVAAVIWTGISCGAGYGLGTMFQHLTHNVGFIVAGVIGVVCGLGWFVKRIRRWVRSFVKKIRGIPEDESPHDNVQQQEEGLAEIDATRGSDGAQKDASAERVDRIEKEKTEQDA